MYVCIIPRQNTLLFNWSVVVEGRLRNDVFRFSEVLEELFDGNE